MSPKATVHYEMTADESKAIDAFRKLSREQQKAALGFQKTAQASEVMGQKTTRAAKQSHASFAKFGRSVKSLTGMLGIGLGGVTLAAAIGGLARGIAASTEKTIAFERELTNLLSLGENTKNIQAVRDEVLGLSIAYRQTTASASDFLFSLQSGQTGLDPGVLAQIRNESLELAEVTGTDLKTALTAVIKTYRMYGDQVASVDALQNKLFIGAEVGYMTFEELATLLPDVAAAAKTFGYSLEEVLGALATATRLGGKNEKTFTGVRNVFSRMSKAVEENLPVTGDLIQDLQMLSRVDADVLKEIFGEEAISVVAILRDNVAGLIEDMRQLSNVEGDLVRQRKELRETDPQYLFAKRMEQAQRAAEAATLRGGASEETRRLSLAYEEAKVAFREMTPAFLHEQIPEKVYAGFAALGAFRNPPTVGNVTIGKNPMQGQRMRELTQPFQAPAQPITQGADALQQSADNLAQSTRTLAEIIDEAYAETKAARVGRAEKIRQANRAVNVNAGA